MCPLNTLKEEGICKKYFLISFDKINRIDNEVEIIHWQDFLHNLWDNKYI